MNDNPHLVIWKIEWPRTGAPVYYVWWGVEK